MDQQVVDKSKRTIFLGIPLGGDGSLCAATHQAIGKLHASKHDVLASECGSSALTFNFNTLWCEALNARLHDKLPIDYFAMLHSDISPADGWLDKLVEIAERTQADVVSAIVPIKDSKGLTSTAFDTSRWTPRRLTMTEAHNLPATFDNKIAHEYFEADLLLNTGCMLVRFDKAWATEVFFNIDNVNVQCNDGRFAAFFEPEDWKFSRWCQAKGLKLVATREVLVGHVGQTLFSNDKPWGNQVVDSGNLTHAAMGKFGMLPHK